jgi:hypothetical protein
LRRILKALQPLIWGFPSVSQRDIYKVSEITQFNKIVKL